MPWKRHFQGCRSTQLPGIGHGLCQAWAGTARGWELRELGVVAGCPQGRGCCQPKPRLDFHQGSAKIAGWQRSWPKWQPWSPQGRSGERERTWGGSRGLDSAELEDGQEESSVGVCTSRAPREFVSTAGAQGLCPCLCLCELVGTKEHRRALQQPWAALHVVPHCQAGIAALSPTVPLGSRSVPHSPWTQKDANCLYCNFNLHRDSL